MHMMIRSHELPDLLDRVPCRVTALSLDCFDTLLWSALDGDFDVAPVEPELACDIGRRFAFAPTMQLIRAAKYRGLTVALVSDIAMSEAQLRALLVRIAGKDLVALVDHVVTTGDHGRDNRTGLLDDVLARIGAWPAQVAHIGGDRDADYDAAIGRGMHAFRLLRSESAAEPCLQEAAAA